LPNAHREQQHALENKEKGRAKKNREREREIERETKRYTTDTKQRE
jgi:hypothetical protein